MESETIEGLKLKLSFVEGLLADLLKFTRSLNWYSVPIPETLSEFFEEEFISNLRVPELNEGIYKGQVWNEVPHGYGALTTKEDVIMEGEFFQGVPHGKFEMKNVKTGDTFEQVYIGGVSQGYHKGIDAEGCYYFSCESLEADHTTTRCDLSVTILPENYSENIQNLNYSVLDIQNGWRFIQSAYHSKILLQKFKGGALVNSQIFKPETLPEPVAISLQPSFIQSTKLNF